MMQKSTDRKYIDLDERDNPLMTFRTVKFYCEKEPLPQKAQDIDVLYLQYKGFQKIIPQTLTQFPILKIIHLNNNGIKRIEGLSNAPGLTHLYLQNNFIQRIQGLQEMKNMVCLNLAHNKFDVVEGLGHLSNLKILNLAENFFTSTETVQELLQISNLTELNLSQNDLQPSEEMVKVISGIKTLTHLFLKSTPIASKLKNYRKSFVSKLKNLIFLDNQAVFPSDHLLAEGKYLIILAWAEGGPQKQAEVKLKITKQRLEKQKIEFEQGYKKCQEKLKQKTQKQKFLNPIVYDHSSKSKQY